MPLFLAAPLLLGTATGGATVAGGAAATGASLGTKAVVGATIASAGITAFGQFQQSRTAQAQAKTQAAWNLYNAKVAKRQAAIERQATADDLRQQKKRAGSAMARLRALRGASGLEMEGSPLLVAEDTAAELAKDAVNIRLRGGRRTQAFETQSILDVSKARTAKTRAAGFGRAAATGAGSTILAGAADAAFRFGQARGTF